MLTDLVTGATFEILTLQDLAAGLVLHLIIFADVVPAIATNEQSASVVPHRSLALITLAFYTGTCASVCLQTLAPVANPRLAVVTDRSNHRHPSCELVRMFYDAITGFLLALGLTALATHGQFLEGITEVAEGPIFL